MKQLESIKGRNMTQEGEFQTSALTTYKILQRKESKQFEASQEG